MTIEARDYIIDNYPTGDLDEMVLHLKSLGTRINKTSTLRVLASMLGVRRECDLKVEMRRQSVLKKYQRDRERIALGLPPLTKKIKPYKVTKTQYRLRRFYKLLGYVLTKDNMFEIGICKDTRRSKTLEQKGNSLGFSFYGCTDNS